MKLFDHIFGITIQVRMTDTCKNQEVRLHSLLCNVVVKTSDAETVYYRIQTEGK